MAIAACREVLKGLKGKNYYGKLIYDDKVFSSWLDMPFPLDKSKDVLQLRAQIWSMPPSSGKSRVIAAVAAMLQERLMDSIDKIIVWFPSKCLLERDKPLYKRLQQIFIACGVPFELKHSSEKLDATINSLVLLYEADYWFFDLEQHVPHAKYVIGFTATNFKSKTSNHERYLQSMNVQVWESKITNAFRSDDV